MIFNQVKHGTGRYRKKFCFFPTRCTQCHTPTGEIVWLGFVEIIEYFVSNGYSGNWNGYIVRPLGRIPEPWQEVKTKLLSKQEEQEDVTRNPFDKAFMLDTNKGE